MLAETRYYISDFNQLSGGQKANMERTHANNILNKKHSESASLHHA